MNSKMVLSITLVLLVIGGVVSISAYTVAQTSAAVNDPTIGSYTYSLSSEGLVSDIVYSSNQNSTLLIKDIFVNGSSTLNISAAGSQAVLREGLEKISIDNATMYSQDELNALAFVTFSSISGILPVTVLNPNMTINLNNSVTQMNLVENSTVDGPFGDYLTQDLLLQMDENWTLYKIDNSVFNGYFFTNGVVSLSNGNTTVHIEGINNRISLTGTQFSILVAGFISSGDFLHLMNGYMYQHQNYHKFTYTPGTGVVSGQYISFTFNEGTGAISNVVSKLPTSTQVFTSITPSGNGQMGSSFFLPYLPLNQVKLFGSIFFYADPTFVYGIHNNPALQMNLMLNNGTMKFVLPSGMNVTPVTLPYGSNNGYNLTPFHYNVSQYMEYGLGTLNEIRAGSSTMMIYNNNVKAFLTVSGGNATYASSDRTITVNTTKLALINFVMPPGLRDISGTNFQDLKYAYEHNNLGGQISCDYLNGTPLNYSFLYNNSLDFKFLGSSAGQVHFQASSGYSHGANFAFYVNKTFLKNSSNVYLYVDGQLATKMGNLGSVLNSTSSAPSYAVIAVQNGYLVVLNMPHFSTHNVTISGTSLTPVGLPYWAIALIAVIIVGAVIAIVYMIVVRRK